MIQNQLSESIVKKGDVLYKGVSSPDLAGESQVDYVKADKDGFKYSTDGGVNYKGVGDASVTELAREVEELKKEIIDLDVVVENTTSSSEITLENSAEASIESNDYNLILSHKRLYDGNLYDEKDVGVNLVKFTEDYFVSKDGITISYTKNTDIIRISVDRNVPDGSIGTKIPISIKLKAKTNYTISNEQNEILYGVWQFVTPAHPHIIAASNKNQQAFTSDVDRECYALDIFIPNHATIIKDTIEYKIMVNEGSIAKPYTPFVPQPTPETKLPIIPTGGSNVVESGGVNLFDETPPFSNPIYYKQENDYIKCLSSFYHFVSDQIIKQFYLKNGLTYTVSLLCKPLSNNSSQFRIIFREATLAVASKIWGYTSNNFESYTYTFISNYTGVVNISICDYSSSHLPASDIAIGIKNIMLNEGSTAIPYTPYRTPIQTTLTFKAKNPAQQELEDNAITIGDYASEVYSKMVGSELKSYCLVKTGKEIFDGSSDEIWIKTSEKMSFYNTTWRNFAKLGTSIIIDKLINKGAALSTTLEPNEASFNTTFNICIDALSLENGNINKWLSQNPLEVYYVLETALEVELEPITAKIPTFAGGTTLTSLNNGITQSNALLDFTNYEIAQLSKVYGLMKDRQGALIVPYGQTNMIYDVLQGKYLSDILPTLGGTKLYKQTITNENVSVFIITTRKTPLMYVDAEIPSGLITDSITFSLYYNQGEILHISTDNSHFTDWGLNINDSGSRDGIGYLISVDNYYQGTATLNSKKVKEVLNNPTTDITAVVTEL